MLRTHSADATCAGARGHFLPPRSSPTKKTFEQNECCLWTCGCYYAQWKSNSNAANKTARSCLALPETSEDEGSDSQAGCGRQHSSLCSRTSLLESRDKGMV